MDASIEEVTAVLPLTPVVFDLSQQQGPCLPQGEVGRIDVKDLTELKRLQQEDEDNQKVRAYWFVVWPESVDMAKLFEILKASGYSVVVSPLHNRDCKDVETGELAKPHYHIIVRFPSPRYLEPVRRLVGSWIYDADGMATAPDGVEVSWYVRPVTDWPRALRYLVHKDDPEKYRYPEGDVITIGFVDLSPLYAKSAADDVDCYMQLIAWCRNNPGKRYDELMDAVFDSGDRSLMRSLTRYSYTIKAYLGDRGRKSEGKQPT